MYGNLKKYRVGIQSGDQSQNGPDDDVGLTESKNNSGWLDWKTQTKCRWTGRNGGKFLLWKWNLMVFKSPWKKKENYVLFMLRIETKIN